MSIYVPPYIIPPGLGTPPPSPQGSPTLPPPSPTPLRSPSPEHRHLLLFEQGQGIMGPPEQVIEEVSALFKLQYYAASLIPPTTPIKPISTQNQVTPACATNKKPGQRQPKRRSTTQVTGRRIVGTAMVISGCKLQAKLYSQRIGDATASGSSGGGRVIDRTYLCMKNKKHFELVDDVMAVKDEDSIIVVEQ